MNFRRVIGRPNIGKVGHNGVSKWKYETRKRKSVGVIPKRWPEPADRSLSSNLVQSTMPFRDDVIEISAGRVGLS